MWNWDWSSGYYFSTYSPQRQYTIPSTKHTAQANEGMTSYFFLISRIQLCVDASVGITLSVTSVDGSAILAQEFTKTNQKWRISLSQKIYTWHPCTSLQGMHFKWVITILHPNECLELQSTCQRKGESSFRYDKLSGFCFYGKTKANISIMSQ